IFVVQQFAREPHHRFRKASLARSTNHRHASRATSPAIVRLRPDEYLAATFRSHSQHRTKQIMRQCVVIGPTADAIEPRSEELKFLVAEVVGLFFEKENRHDLFFKNATREKMIGNLQQEIHPSFAHDAAPETHRKFSQLGRIPAMRPYFFLEKA